MKVRNNGSALQNTFLPSTMLTSAGNASTAACLPRAVFTVLSTPASRSTVKKRCATEVFAGASRPVGDGVVTYQVVPIDDDAPPVGELASAYITDSLETYSLVAEALEKSGI